MIIKNECTTKSDIWYIFYSKYSYWPQENFLRYNNVKLLNRSFACVLYEMSEFKKAFEGNAYEIIINVSGSELPKIEDEFLNTLLQK